MRTVRFAITADDLAHGKRRCEGGDCPAMLAIRRELPGVTVSVGCFYVRLNGRPYPTPDALREFVLAYDEDKAVCAVEFEMALEDRDTVPISEWSAA